MSSGDDDTLASDGADDTLASSSGSGQPVRVQAGARDDYGALIEIDPRHFVLGKERARGGMGRIVEARDRRLGRRIAIKELLNVTPGGRSRFEREARITATLQHPAIINILEAGTWRDGTPFYVMKLVDGESLDRAVAARTTLAERLGLVPNVIGIVDALAYAHGEGVIHRDLKPSNVLVGSFGETVVIDWGLAKRIGDGDDAGDASGDEAMVGETAAGDVLGTPAYMPPEQARGEAVDARADVYALGALLYHVLAGKAPYEAASSAAILDLVLAGSPPALATRVEGVPPDLITIVEKAMASDRGDRYPTAKELSADLARFQTGQLVAAHRYSTGQLVRRWVRRHRAAVTVAAALLAVSGFGAIYSVRRVLAERDAAAEQRVAAESARTDSDTRRSAAQQLVDFMLDELRRQLQPIGKLSALRGVAGAVGTYYDSVGGVDVAHDPKAAKARMNALLLLALVQHDAGETEAALKTYAAARALAEARVASAPHDLETNVDLGRVLLELGRAQIGSRQDPEAGATLQAAERVLLDVLRDAPTHDAARRKLAEVYGSLAANAGGHGTIDSALDFAHKRVALAAQLAAESATNDDVQLDLALARYTLGAIAAVAHDYPTAKTELGGAAEIQDRVLAKRPGDTGLLERDANSHRQLGKALLDSGAYDAARSELQHALALHEKLAAHDSDNFTWQGYVGFDHSYFGMLAIAQHQGSAAVAELRIAEQIDSNHIANGHDTEAVRESRANVRSDLALAQLSVNDVDGALATLRGELDDTRLAYKGDRRDMELGQTLEQLGDIEQRRHHFDAAADAFAQSAALAQHLFDSASDNVGYRVRLAEATDEQGALLEAKGDAAAAVAMYRKEVSLYEPLADAKDRPAQRFAYALACTNLANVVAPEEARALLDKALSIAHALAAADQLRPSQREIVTTMEKRRAALR